jgi:hypothetical protein
MQRFVGQQLYQPPGLRVDIAHILHESIHAIGDQVWNAACPGRYRRHTARHSLQCDKTESLELTWQM